jgi:predicted metal-dependent HD superfamily phosphohydrolase
MISWNEHKNLHLAAWYHDVVYDPRRQDNEDRSADVAREALQALLLDSDRIVRVCDLIRMTKDHIAPEKDIAAQWFLDADLSILNGYPEDYERYSAEIRQEYAWVADEQYYPARRAVLQRLLDRPAIFGTPRQREFEADARANIAAEIAQIDAILRTLPP